MGAADVGGEGLVSLHLRPRGNPPLPDHSTRAAGPHYDPKTTRPLQLKRRYNRRRPIYLHPVWSRRMGSLDPVLLSRMQMAFTLSFHILFPTLTIGLAVFLAVL